MTELGHVDFFPGSTSLEEFGWNQPGCWQFEDVGSCSHSRSHDLFISSVSRPCHVLQTCSDTSEIPHTCTNITSSSVPVMGWWTGSGVKDDVFTVNTTSSAPFCDEYIPPSSFRNKKKKIIRRKKKHRSRLQYQIVNI